MQASSDNGQQGEALDTQAGLVEGDAEQGIVWRDSRHYVRQYRSEDDLKLVMTLIDNELSEPYSIFTYRYFIYNWPNLCYLAFDAASNRCFGTVVCKLDNHRSSLRGYLAMLTVEKEYRGHMMGTRLVHLAIGEMVRCNAEEVVLEAEVNNIGALKLYAKLGFIRDKRLYRYYMNGVDAFRLKLRLPRYGLLPFDHDGAGDWIEMTGMEPTVQKLAIQ